MVRLFLFICKHLIFQKQRLIDQLGRIPILVDNDQSPPHVVMESSAELLYLVNLADADNLFWFSDPIDQSEAFQWLIFWHASGQPNQGQYNFFRNNADRIPRECYLGVSICACLLRKSRCSGSFQAAGAAGL
jgi:glutathione S-transferase